MIDYITDAKNKKICTKSKEGLIKKFTRIYKLCNGDLNKFVLLLRKGVYPYEYMNSWERFDETSLQINYHTLLSSLYNTPCNRFYNNYVINICPRQL